jgi:hypothetical protein
MQKSKEMIAAQTTSDSKWEFRACAAAPRAEVIAALVTDKYSGFKNGDEAILEAASDARLEEFKAATSAAKSAAEAHARLETEHRNVSARLKVAEERIKEAESEMTEEQFIARAPESIKATLNEIKAAEAAERAALVGALKALTVNTEEDLKKKTTDELKTLAKYARVQVPDFSGRALPREQRNASDRPNYAPPDPYADGLKALRGESKAVN